MSYWLAAIVKSISKIRFCSHCSGLQVLPRIGTNQMVIKFAKIPFGTDKKQLFPVVIFM